MKLSVQQAAAEAPDRIAVVAGGDEIAYAALAQRVAARETDLRRIGVSEKVTRVVFTPDLDIDDIVTVYALMELAVPVALLHPRLTDSERRRQRDIVRPAIDLDDLKPLDLTSSRRSRLSSSSSSSSSSLADGEAAVPPKTPRGPPPSSEGSVASRTPNQPYRPGPSPSNAASDHATHAALNERPLAVLFTSGTTGVPRGVVLSRRAFLASAAASEANLGRQDDDRWLLCMPLAHVGGLSILTRCLISRTCVVVAPRFDPDTFVESVQSFEVTLASLVPTMLRRILDAHPNRRPPSSLRAILLGGSAAPKALLEESAERGFPILTTYGLTETCSQVATQPCGTQPSPHWGAGKPLPGTGVRIRDGAIQVRGPTLLTGYLTENRDAHLFDDDGWFDTGDRGSFDGEGNLHVLGRGAEFIVTGGETVSAREVEEVLASCPGVIAACVVGVPDPEWGEAVAAGIVTRHGAAPADAELASFLESRLAPFKRPKRILRLPALPLTSTGKPDRPALIRLLGRGGQVPW